MPFDLKNLNPSAKFYWGKSKREWVELRPLSREDLREMRKRAVIRKTEYYKPDSSDIQPYRYETETVDEDCIFEMMWEKQIIDWNIVDPEENKIPCTKENKLLMINQCREFSEWVSGCLLQLSSDEKKKKEDSEKN